MAFKVSEIQRSEKLNLTEPENSRKLVAVTQVKPIGRRLGHFIMPVIMTCLKVSKSVP